MDPTEEAPKAEEEVKPDVKPEAVKDSKDATAADKPKPKEAEAPSESEAPSSSKKYARKPTIAKEESSKPGASSKPPTEPTPEMLALIGKEIIGSIKWYNVQKGYGWIVPDTDVGGDIFVHQSHLVMEGFRSAAAPQTVKFIVQKRDKGIEATNVRGVDGPLQPHSERPLPKRVKENSIRCYKCGRTGNHVASRCKVVTEPATVCYLCKKSGHIRKHCPEKRDLHPREEQAEVKRRHFADDDDPSSAV
uniref:CCHC-type domain-containing protein n=1 Tax=Panagrellus redivivus TaxID=6233 RepID=A0A7E4UPK2_PANRE